MGIGYFTLAGGVIGGAIGDYVGDMIGNEIVEETALRGERARVLSQKIRHRAGLAGTVGGGTWTMLMTAEIIAQNT